MARPPVYAMTTYAAEETVALGRRLGKLLSPGQVVALCGPLGSGKTTFIKGIALGLGLADTREVKSPTFVFIKEYAGRVPIAHVDLYRLERTTEAARIGLERYLNDRTICLIEWAEKFPELLPVQHLRVTFEHRAPTERRLTFAPHGAAYAPMLTALRKHSP